MTNPGNVRDEINKLSDGIRAMQRLREAEPAYVLQDATTLLVPLGYATDLRTARSSLKARISRSAWGKMRICRLEPVEGEPVKRGRK